MGDPYTRPHDPSLCDHIVIESRPAKGVVPAPRASFDEDESTDPVVHTMVGPLLGRPRRPADPATPVCKECGLPVADQATLKSKPAGVYCDGRCELDVEP